MDLNEYKMEFIADHLDSTTRVTISKERALAVAKRAEPFTGLDRTIVIKHGLNIPLNRAEIAHLCHQLHGRKLAYFDPSIVVAYVKDGADHYVSPSVSEKMLTDASLAGDTSLLVDLLNEGHIVRLGSLLDVCVGLDDTDPDQVECLIKLVHAMEKESVGNSDFVLEAIGSSKKNAVRDIYATGLLGKPDEGCFETLFNAGADVDMIDTLVDAGGSLNANILEMAVDSDEESYVQRLLDLGCLMDSRAVEGAVRNNNFKILEMLIEHDCPWYTETIMDALAAGHQRIFTYLCKQGEVDPKEYLEMIPPQKLSSVIRHMIAEACE